MIEREKRYNLKNNDLTLIPSSQITSKIKIEQIYTNTNIKNSPSTRIRKSSDEEMTSYSHCSKYRIEENVVEEVEVQITENQYERISELVNKIPIKKERWNVSIGDSYNYLFAEVDIYLDENKIIVEVEFANDEGMNCFVPPSWFGEEIKEKKSYSYEKFCEINSNVLWRGL